MEIFNILVTGFRSLRNNLFCSALTEYFFSNVVKVLKNCVLYFIYAVPDFSLLEARVKTND